MVVTAAKSAGFCFGVARAVRMAEELAAAPVQPETPAGILTEEVEIEVEEMEVEVDEDEDKEG